MTEWSETSVTTAEGPRWPWGGLCYSSKGCSCGIYYYSSKALGTLRSLFLFLQGARYAAESIPPRRSVRCGRGQGWDTNPALYV